MFLFVSVIAVNRSSFSSGVQRSWQGCRGTRGMRPAPGLRLQAVPGALVPVMAGGESPWGWLVLCSVPQRSASQLDQGLVTACLQAGLRWHLTVICSWWLSRAPPWCRYFKTQTWFLLGFEFESSQSLKQPAGARLCCAGVGTHCVCSASL